MLKHNRTEDWVKKLWANWVIARQEKKEIAGMLLIALLVEAQRIKRIKDLAKRLFSDYKLTSSLFSISDDFVLWRRIFFLKTGY